MSICSRFQFSPREIAAQRALNRRLAWLPRMGVNGSLRRLMVRAALRAGDWGADAKLRRRGLSVETLSVDRGAATPLRFRVIRPQGPPRGIVLDIHGGAWAFGSPAMDDLSNAAFARHADALVLSLDYALALPRLVKELQAEALAALTWLLRQEDGPYAALPVVLTGESAGAHLMLGAAIGARDAGVSLNRVAGMLLHCGAYDLGGSPSAEAAGPETLVLHGPTLREQVALIFPNADDETIREPQFSPVYARLEGLPPTLIAVGDIDPLRDDSRLLAERLEAAGVPVELAMLPEAPHGLIHFGGAYADRLRRESALWAAERFAAAG